MVSPAVTVLITTYNYGQFIEQAIDSALSQALPEGKLEIVVVDDGSTDDTPARVAKYGSGIRYFQKPNGGQASALNFGFAEARGEIVALLDADDLFLPGKLAAISDAFRCQPELAMVYHPLREVRPDTGEQRDHFFASVSGDLRSDPLKMFRFVPQPTSAISFRRTALDSLLPIPERIRMMADCYAVALVPFVGPVLALEQPLALYRVHGANAYFSDEREMPRPARERRLEIWNDVVPAMTQWLAARHLADGAAGRAFLDRWYLRFSEEKYRLQPPSRFQFFVYLLKHNRASRRAQSPLFTAFNYAFAPAALLFADGSSDYYQCREKILSYFKKV